MSKTIEEAAREYAKSLWECGMYDNATPANEEDMRYAFKAGVSYASSLPLSSRLTPAEKERVRDEYDEARIFCENIDPCGENYAVYEAKKCLLQRIFGKEMFEKE